MTAKKKKKFPLSPHALGFIGAGILLLMVPYLIGHNGYGGELLIADAGVGPPFHKTLVLVGRHNIDGAVGFIINKSLPEEEKTKLSAFIRDSGIPIGYGGPLETSDKIFVLEEKKPLHPGENPDFDISAWDDAIKETPNLLDKIRQSIKNGEQHYKIVTGYVGWGPFQLELEILAKKSWIAVPSTHNIVFQEGDDTSWSALEPREKAKRGMGIQG